MNEKINTQDIIDHLSINANIDRDDADKFLSQLVNSIEKGLTADELVKIKDFGAIKLSHIRDRASIDVNTQEKIIIPAHRRVNFTPASILKNLVNKPFAHFETTLLNDGVLIDGLSKTNVGDRAEEVTLKDDNEHSHINEPDSAKKSSAIESKGEIESDTASAEPDNAGVGITEESIINIESGESTDKNVEKDEVIEQADAPLNHEITKELKPETKKKSPSYWWVAAILFLILAVGVSFIYFYNNDKDTQEKIEYPVVTESVEIAPETPQTQSIAETEIAKNDSIKEDIPPKAKKVKMYPGRTLRLIAQDYFGNREFWIYIYFKNKDKIDNPNVVPIGLELTLPETTEYDMNANNVAHIEKAKQLGDALIDKF